MNNILILNPSLIRPFVLRRKLNLKAVCLLGLSLTISLVAFYIFQINKVTQMSFTVANYENQITDLNKESKNLESSFSGLSSLSSIEALLAAQGYEKVDKVYYIQVPIGTVAVK